MFDPIAQKRRNSAERAVLALRNGMIFAGVCVAAAIAMSLLTDPIASLMDELDSGNLVFRAIALVLNSVLFVLAHLMPISLMALGVGWPIATYLRYSAYVVDQERRHGRRAPAAMPLRKARLVTTAVVAGLLIVGVLGIYVIKPIDTKITGIEGKLIESVPRDSPYY